MPNFISRLNCFSRKKRRRQRLNTDDDVEDKQTTKRLLSGTSTSSTPTRKVGSNSDTTSKGSKSLCLSPTPNPDDDSSIPTIDHDYKQNCNYSLSDAGGTIGSRGQSLTNFSQAASAMSPGNFGASSSVAGAGASIEGRPYNNNYPPPPPSYPSHLMSPPRQREEFLEIYAPAGKLGLVIDTPSSATTPVVHAIKETCPIRNDVSVGDKLVAVDDVDVREMSAVEVSKLISKKSDQGRRKLTIIRRTGGGGMY